MTTLHKEALLQKRGQVRRDMELGKERGKQDAERAKTEAQERTGNGRTETQPATGPGARRDF